jgi:hypothetical protein
MKPYSKDLRVRIRDTVDRHDGSLQQIADRFQVSLTFIVRLNRRRRETGSLDPKPTTNLASTNSTKLGFSLPVPSIAEQRLLLIELNRWTAALDKQIYLLRSSIEKFREYRQALISAAVTGKLDVTRSRGDCLGVDP